MKISEIFYSLQGEGYWAGIPAVFVRFSGCNRFCSFCDTQHNFFSTMSVKDILQKVMSLGSARRVVVTGGEPMTQLEGFHDLSLAFAAAGYEVHLETNGDFEVDPSEVDWLTVSPKGPEWKQKIGDEIKVVYTGQSKEELEQYLESSDKVYFKHRFLQPCSTPEGSNVEATVEYIKADPRWRLSLQIHKLIGVR
ncbi:MAG: 7-carboxy-7-deazaguanine synthase [Candidatus Thorarchaeota archaeon]|nr:MAG: 7-carboxy-7-deazaguanine synthase [Candidatus Thorarchaeota archaeon]